MSELDKYPCIECGKTRTKAEGGTTFTVCDKCWEKTHKSTRPASMVKCPECGGTGTASEHEYGCRGECRNCPVPVPCERCNMTGYVDAPAPKVLTDEELKEMCPHWNYNEYLYWMEGAEAVRDAMQDEERDARLWVDNHYPNGISVELELAREPALKGYLAGASRRLRECRWSEDNDPDYGGVFKTQCGEAFTFINGTPADNNLKFCCYCGGKLTYLTSKKKGGVKWAKK